MKPTLEIKADQFDGLKRGDKIMVKLARIEIQATVTFHREPSRHDRLGFARLTIGGLEAGILYVKGKDYVQCLSP